MSVLDKLNATPTYVFEVPSTGEQIKFRPFLHKEERVLQMSKETNDLNQYLQAVKDTIKACSYGNFDVDNAPTYDIEEFFIALRSKSVGEVMNITLLCQHQDESTTDKVCGGEVEISFNLNDIKIDKNLITKDKFIVELNDETSIELSSPNYDTMAKLIELRQNPDSVEIIDLLITMVKSVFTKDDVYTRSDYSDEELKTFLENLTSQQIDKMLDVIKDTPTLIYDVEGECPKCHKMVNYRFSGLYDFFV